MNKARRHFQKEKEQEAKSTAQERITDHVVSSTYTLHYHSGRKDETVQAEERLAASIEGQMKRLKSGALECTMYHQAEAMHPPAVPGALYRCEHAVFAGWILRFRIGVDWYWYLEDDSFCFSRMYDAKKQKPRKLFASGDSLPVFSITGVQSAVAEAVWEEEREER